MATGDAMKGSVSTFFFPLKTNVQYFAMPERFLSLEARIKQALILYERVVFESGLYITAMGPDGAVRMYTPMSQLAHSDRKSGVDQHHEGFSVWIQPSGANTPPQLLYSSAIEYQFEVEFHTLFNKLTTEFGVDGLDMVDVHISQDGEQHSVLLAESYLKAEDAVLPEGSKTVQKLIVQNLLQDLMLASALGYAFSIDPLHAPILDHIIHKTAGLQIAPGPLTLELLVPHCAALPWEQIVQVRNDPAIAEFRRKVFVVEKTVRDMLPEAPKEEIEREVNNIITQELIGEVKARMAPRGSKLVGNVILQLVGGLVSLIGFIQTGYSVGKDIANSLRERKSWLAVLMRLSRVEMENDGQAHKNLP
jgi:hypothetical protein